jgi:hypothetical protein
MGSDFFACLGIAGSAELFGMTVLDVLDIAVLFVVKCFTKKLFCVV